MATLTRIEPKQFIAGAVFQISDERTHLFRVHPAELDDSIRRAVMCGPDCEEFRSLFQTAMGSTISSGFNGSGFNGSFSPANPMLLNTVIINAARKGKITVSTATRLLALLRDTYLPAYLGAVRRSITGIDFAFEPETQVTDVHKVLSDWTLTEYMVHHAVRFDRRPAGKLDDLLASNVDGCIHELTDGAQGSKPTPQGIDNRTWSIDAVARHPLAAAYQLVQAENPGAVTRLPEFDNEPSATPRSLWASKDTAYIPVLKVHGDVPGSDDGHSNDMEIATYLTGPVVFAVTAAAADAEDRYLSAVEASEALVNVLVLPCVDAIRKDKPTEQAMVVAKAVPDWIYLLNSMTYGGGVRWPNAVGRLGQFLAAAAKDESHPAHELSHRLDVMMALMKYVTTRMEGAAGGDDIALTGRVALRDAVTACFDAMLTDIGTHLVGAICDHRLDAASYAMASAHMVHVGEAKWDAMRAEAPEAAFTA